MMRGQSKWMRGRRRWRRERRYRYGAAAVAGGTVLAATMATVVLVQERRGDDGLVQLVEYARADARGPVELVTAAARSHRIVLLGDHPGSAVPKRITAAAIEELASGPGLDAVALEVPSDEQERIDRYLESYPENTTILLSSPRLLPGDPRLAREYMAIYRQVWRVNHELGATRRVRILAMDLPDWPPSGALQPRAAPRRYAGRDEHMLEVLETQLLSRNPRARVLILAGGYHALKRGGGEVRAGSGPPEQVTWLGARLRERHPGAVYSILTDAGVRRTGTGLDPAYEPSRVFDVFRRHLHDLPGPFAVPVNDRFDVVGDPLRPAAAGAAPLRVVPAPFRLRDAVDAYIYLGGG